MERTQPDRPPAPLRSPLPDPNRRRVLAVGAVAGAALLAGCGSGGSDGEAGGPAAGGSSPAESSSGTGGAPGAALVATSKVPVGGGVVLDKAKVVVTQPDSGTFEAFSAVCTHMQCLVGRVADGVISCPCHGSEYSAADGSVRQGPATKPLPKVPIKVEGGEVLQA